MRGPAPIGRLSVTALFRSMPEWHSSIERVRPLGGRPAIGIALQHKNPDPPIIVSDLRNGGYRGYQPYGNHLTATGFGPRPRRAYLYDSALARGRAVVQVPHEHRDRESRRRHYQGRPAGALRYDR